MSDEKQKKIFAKNLNYYIALNGKQQNEFAKEIEEKATTVNMWCNGKSMPSVGKIQKIADYFGILKSDLVDDKTDMSPEQEYSEIVMKIGMSDDRFQKIITDYYKMPKEEKEALCTLIELFVEKKSRT